MGYRGFLWCALYVGCIVNDIARVGYAWSPHWVTRELAFRVDTSIFLV